MLDAGFAHAGQRVKVLGNNPQSTRICAFHKADIAIGQLWHLGVRLCSLCHKSITPSTSTPSRLVKKGICHAERSEAPRLGSALSRKNPEPDPLLRLG